MSRCQRCGSSLPEGSLKYQVALRVRSLFDGALAESDVEPPEGELAKILQHMEPYTEEELERQVYEDDIFIMCPACKEAFMQDIYSHLSSEASPELGRAHLIH